MGREGGGGGTVRGWKFRGGGGGGGGRGDTRFVLGAISMVTAARSSEAGASPEASALHTGQSLFIPNHLSMHSW